MRVIHPYAGDSIGDVCRMAYFELLENKEPILMCFNEVTILFTHDSVGYHHKDHDIHTVEVEYKRGVTRKDLLKPIRKAKQTQEKTQ